MLKKLVSRWDEVKAAAELADIAFVFLRFIIFAGGIAWFVLADISQETFADARSVFIYFILYSLLIYLLLFFYPQKKRVLYGYSLFFDLLYASLLVRATGGLASSFFTAFYLITAIYSFYYGVVAGFFIAAASALLLLVSGGFDSSGMHWTDFSVRAAFLFLLALPLGLLSQKLKKDKYHIEDLNKNLERSIEDLKYVQARLIEAEKLSALGRLTADVAHEIRNPLTSIGGFARRLDKKLHADSSEKKYSEIVVAEVSRLERILKDVLTFSRDARNNMKYQDINEVVRESVQTLSGICEEQSISVKEDLGSDLPRILLDASQVRQAINNLATNAVDAMPKGGRLKIQTFMEELFHVNYVVIEVSDTGCGIPREKTSMIFEPFFSTKEIGVGTGLGLSICKKIIDEHNGLITVDSEVGKGTSFELFFPYQNKEDENKLKCWEVTKCGIEKAEGAAEMRCPAYPNYGRICWVVAGTFCGQRVSGAIAQKLGDCKKCQFYQGVVVTKTL